MINNKLVFGIGTMLVLLTVVFLNIPSKAVIAQEQPQQQEIGETINIMSKELRQKIMDEVKKENPMHADIVDKIPSMSLEETVKNLFAVTDIEQLLKMHAEDLVEGKTMGNSNQTTQ
jgi:hypothetical protein